MRVAHGSCTDMNVQATWLVDPCAYSVEALAECFKVAQAFLAFENRRNDLVCIVTFDWAVRDDLEIVGVSVRVLSWNDAQAVLQYSIGTIPPVFSKVAADAYQASGEAEGTIKASDAQAVLRIALGL